MCIKKLLQAKELLLWRRKLYLQREHQSRLLVCGQYKETLLHGTTELSLAVFDLKIALVREFKHSRFIS